jgi:hypothetical protein
MSKKENAIGQLHALAVIMLKELIIGAFDRRAFWV